MVVRSRRRSRPAIRRSGGPTAREGREAGPPITAPPTGRPLGRRPAAGHAARSEVDDDAAVVVEGGAPHPAVSTLSIVFHLGVQMALFGLVPMIVFRRTPTLAHLGWFVVMASVGAIVIAAMSWMAPYEARRDGRSSPRAGTLALRSSPSPSPRREMRGRRHGRRADVDNRFFENPILNSPYERPARHWELGPDGQPTQNVVERRRRAAFISPHPQAEETRPRGQGGCGRAGIPGSPDLRRRQGALHPRTAVRATRRDHQRRPPRGRRVAAATGPAPVAGDPGDRAPAPALAGPPVHRRPALLLPDRGGRDRHLAHRGRPADEPVRPALPPVLGGRQPGSESGAAPPRAQARDRRGQDHRDGHADRLADRQRGAPPAATSTSASTTAPGRRPKPSPSITAPKSMPG